MKENADVPVEKNSLVFVVLKIKNRGFEDQSAGLAEVAVRCWCENVHQLPQNRSSERHVCV